MKNKKQRSVVIVIYEYFSKNQLASLLKHYEGEKIEILSFKTTPSIIREEMKSDELFFAPPPSETVRRKFYETFLNIYQEIPKFKNKWGEEIQSFEFLDLPIYWILNHTEKNIWGSSFANDILFLLYLKEYIDNQKKIDEIRVFSKNSSLNLSIKKMLESYSDTLLSFYGEKDEGRLFWMIFLGNFAKQLLKFCYNKHCLLKNGFKTLNNISRPNMLISILPSWWDNSDEGCEIFFQNHLRAYEILNNLSYLFFLNRPFNKSDLEIYRKIKDQKKSILWGDLLFLARDLNILFRPDLYLKLGKILKILKRNMIHLKYEGIDFSPVVFQEVKKGINSGVFSWSLIVSRILKRIAIPVGTKTFMRYEFQAFERVIYKALQEKGCVMFGLQHSAVGDCYMNYIFPRNFFNNFKIPSPNYFLVTGPKAKKMFVESGLPEKHIKIVGPVRFEKILKYKNHPQEKYKLREKMGLGSERIILFIPASIFYHETLSMLLDLFKALRSDSKKYLIILKCNPNTEFWPDFNFLISELITKQDDNVQVLLFDKKFNFFDVIVASDFVYFTGGSVAFEAMLLNRTSFVYNYKYSLSHNPIVSYPNSCFLVENAEDIRQLLKDSAYLEKSRNLDFNLALNDIFDFSNVPHGIIPSLIGSL